MKNNLIWLGGWTDGQYDTTPVWYFSLALVKKKKIFLTIYSGNADTGFKTLLWGVDKYKNQNNCIKMLQAIVLDLDHRLELVKSLIILWVTSESVSKQWLQCLGWMIGASAHGASNDATHHSHHQHSDNNAKGDDLRQGVSTGCGEKGEYRICSFKGYANVT